METINKPMELEITPDAILVISRQNAKTFHETVKARIKENGYGLLEYLETIKFFEKLAEVISGNSQSKNPEDKEGDKEIRQMVRDEIAKWGKEKCTTARGVKFEAAETGTKYDFTNCNDPILLELKEKADLANANYKARQDFLKNVHISGVDIITPEGEVVKIFPPSKTSNSSYKITLPR